MLPLIDDLNETIAYLARATRKVEELPHSQRQALMYGMICDQGTVLSLILELAEQEAKEGGGVTKTTL